MTTSCMMPLLKNLFLFPSLHTHLLFLSLFLGGKITSWNLYQTILQEFVSLFFLSFSIFTFVLSLFFRMEDDPTHFVSP